MGGLEMSDEEKTGNRSVGERGESIAELYLRGQGFTILEKNYRGKTGEIDIAILIPDHEVPKIEHIRNAFDLAY